MKKAILVLVILTINLSAIAKCKLSGINVWPAQVYISTNTIFIIEGYSKSQELIRQLNKRNKIYLKSNSELIPIKVLRILEGQYELTQAILKPTKELTNGNTYGLYIDSLEMYDNYEVVRWTVNAIIDNQKPVWNCEPTYNGKSFKMYGCGPSKYVNFCGSIKDNSPTVIYAKVYNKKSKTSADYFLTEGVNKISLGHGMCSGEFSFGDNTEYQVQFGLMDASGNENVELTQPINFTSPTEDNQSTEENSCNCTVKSNVWLYCLFGLGIIVFGILIFFAFSLSRNFPKRT